MIAQLQRLFAVLGLALAFSVAAQDAPVRILVGFPPGGTSDLIARLVADRMKASLGTNVIVENKPGINGILAAETLKNAPPDGRTLMIAPIVVTVFAPLTHSKLRYDPIKDFAPVSLAAIYPLALAVGAGSPARTLQEYIAWVRASPAQAAYGLPTAGGPPHFFGVMLARATSLELVPVPYKGGGPLVNDLIGGQVPAGITVLSELVKHHESGKLRLLATSGSKRSPVAPDVPTFKELGYAGIEGDGWQAFHAPAGTPRPVLERLSAAIASAINAPEVREKLLVLGLEPVGSTPDELARRMAEDTARWAPAVRAAGFHVDGPTPEARQSLAPSGKLRVALLEGSPVHLVRNPASGEAKGVGHDLGKELATRLGIPFEPVAYKAVGPLLNGAKSGEWDVAFVGISSERRQFLEFTGKLMELDIGYLVPPGSPISGIGDVDRPGVRVAVVEKGSPDVFLTGALKNATLVRAATLAGSLDLVRSGKVDAFAGLKANLYDVSSSQMPGSRLLEGRPGSEEQAMAMPKGRDPAMAYARTFIEQAKSEGVVKAAIDRVQLRGAVVAP